MGLRTEAVAGAGGSIGIGGHPIGTPESHFMTTRKGAMRPDLFLTSDGQGPRLRIGLLLDGLELPLWQRSVIEGIGASDFAELTVVLVADGPCRHRDHSHSWRGLLFRQYARIDRRLYGGRRVPAPDRTKDCRDLLDSVPRVALAVEAAGTTWTRRIPDEQLEWLRGQNLDVLIDLGHGALHESIIPVPAYGVWRCHHGDDSQVREGPAGFAELVHQVPHVSVSLHRHGPVPGEREILATATTSTVAGISWALNRFGPLWLGPELIQQTLHRLHRYGPDAIATTQVRKTDDTPDPDLRVPTNLEVVRFLATGLARKAGHRIRHPVADLVNHWRLAVRSVPAGAGGLPVLAGAGGFRWIESPPDRHWCDPFLLERQGGRWLFFEEYLYQEGRGVVSVAPMDEDGRLGPARRILDTGGHLSYPFIFEDGEDVYLLPESADQGSTTLYRAVDFPYQWEQAAVIGEGLQLLDTTVFVDQGLYWLFTTVPGRHRSGYTLLLFWSESLAGRWNLHPASPISRDIRYARGAGGILRSDGRLYRPVQDGAGGYGRKVHFFELLRLTPDDFRQEWRATLGPADLPDAPRGLEGIHTYSRTGRFEVIDGVRLERRSWPGSRTP